MCPRRRFRGCARGEEMAEWTSTAEAPKDAMMKISGPSPSRMVLIQAMREMLRAVCSRECRLCRKGGIGTRCAVLTPSHLSMYLAASEV
jgi:hypothetical protein